MSQWHPPGTFISYKVTERLRFDSRRDMFGVRDTNNDKN